MISDRGFDVCECVDIGEFHIDWLVRRVARYEANRVLHSLYAVDVLNDEMEVPLYQD